MSVHVKCFEVKQGKEGPYVDVSWHSKSPFTSMKAALDACDDGRHAEHAHEVKQEGHAASRDGFWTVAA